MFVLSQRPADAGGGILREGGTGLVFLGIVSQANGSRPAYIAIARKAFEGDPFWDEPRPRTRWEAWVDVIRLARYEPGTWAAGSTPVQLGRGETRPLSRVFLAHRWGWGEKQVWGYIQQLLQMDRLRAGQRTTQGTTYLVVNYDHYQGQGTGNGTGEGTAEAQPEEQDRGQREGQPRGQGKGQKEKHRSSNQETKTSRQGAPRQTWLTPYWDAWQSVYGGTPNGGLLSKALKPLHDQHGEPETIRRWKYYLSQTPAEYANPHRFASTWGRWDPSHGPSLSSGERATEAALWPDD